jgi:phosphate transport system substrate-binding protein
MVNPAGSKAYPISGISWLLVYSQQKDAAKGKKLIEFLTWAFANGESYAASLDYVALPDSLIKRAMLRVNAIKY